MNNPGPHYRDYYMNRIRSLPSMSSNPKVSDVETQQQMQMLPLNHDIVVEPGSVRLSPKVEVAIVGGLGLLIVASPAIIDFFRRAAKFLRIRFTSLTESLNQADFGRKLAVLNRRRKRGSIVRVIGSILPDCMFNPPCRIYIPKWAQLPSNQWSIQPLITATAGFTPIKNPTLPSENFAEDGLIEAFEVDSEIISSVSGAEDDDDDDDGVSSTPEGWTKEQRLMANFNPTMNATEASFARCSTPKASKKRGLLTLTQASSLNSGTLVEDSKLAEIDELKEIVSLAMLKINKLENAARLQGQETLQVSATSQLPSSTVSLSSPTEENSNPPPPPMPRPNVSNAPSGPPPPPPPPPPMPPMPQDGNQRLVINKKGNQAQLIQKKPQMSLTDVLKELPNAKLRRVERSPGGTPIKPQLKPGGAPLDIGSQLKFALQKRYASMHSPACDSDVDKENMDGSGDSFEDDNPALSPAKRVLFPSSSARSPRKRNSQENRLPFGQHLLKKRNAQQSSTDVSPLASSPLREQNN